MKKVVVVAVCMGYAFALVAQNIIPRPQNLILGEKVLTFSKIDLVSSPGLENEASFLTTVLKDRSLLNSGKPEAIIKLDTQYISSVYGAYRLHLEEGHIVISGKGSTGVFYGIQSLIQLIGTSQQSFNTKVKDIIDYPNFKWRGMHLDVSRHFFDADFVKKYIDMLALHKMNSFHWHLTDDQGWRIEIKKYPLLTEIGSKRPESVLAKNFEPYVGDGIPVSGFYTQEEIKDIVAYAAQRHINVVPEIEMPGHSVAAVTAYPYLGCTGEQVEVRKLWGVSEDVLCVKEETFRFLYDVLDEVMELFPSEYIHIGGDEVPKTRWKACPVCQKVIHDYGLKDEHELQSYFITQIDKYITSKGRRTIGWDEILEGGLAPNAAVMSWRGEQGGIEAARMRHEVVMSPGSHCYFDHYQGKPQNEPMAFGGYLPLDKVYAYQPVPAGLEEEFKTYVLGAQANLWTEYIASPEHAEYMAMPRMAALSEVLWTDESLRDYQGFVSRLECLFALYEENNIHYSKAMYDVDVAVIPMNSGLETSLSSPIEGSAIRYTTDGSKPTKMSVKYEQAFMIHSDAEVRAAVFVGENLAGNVSGQDLFYNLATTRPVWLETEPSKYYNTGGAGTLVNGIIGGKPRVNQEWLGWSGQDMVATIDLGENRNIKEVFISFLDDKGSWIHLPEHVEVYVGKSQTSLGKKLDLDSNMIAEKMGKDGVLNLNVKAKVRFVRIAAKHKSKIPAGYAGEGKPAWLFCSEIGVK